MYKAVKSRTNGQSELVQTIAVPRFHKPQRIPSFPALERTSVLGFTDTFTLNTEAVPGQETRLAIIRDPVFPLWRWVDYGDEASIYRVMEVNMIAQPSIGLTFTPVWQDTLLTYPIASWPAPAAPLYVYEGKEYLPSLNTHVAIQYRFAANPGPSAVSCTGTYLSNFFDIETFEFDGVPTIGTSGGKWYASLVGILPTDGVGFKIDVINYTATNGVLCEAVYVGSTTSPNGDVYPCTAPTFYKQVRAMLPATTATEYASAPIVWQSTRANSVAVLLSNVSAVMQKEGTVNAARAPSESGINMFSSDSWSTQFTRVHPKERYFGPLEKGLYSFTLPDSVSELYHEYDNIGYLIPVFKHYLDGNRYAHCVLMKDPDHVAAMAVTVDRHIEFKSNSVLFPYGFATTPLESYHQAQMALANIGVFYENPTHLATIAALAKQAAMKYGPRLLQAALPYAVKGANKILSAVNNKLGTMVQAGLTQPKPKPARRRQQQKSRPRRQIKQKRR